MSNKRDSPKRKDKIQTSLQNLVEMKQEVFERFVSDIHEMYERGRFKMLFLGPSARVSFFEEDTKVLMKKYAYPTKRELSEDIQSVISCIHYVLCEEVEMIAGKLSTKASENFKKKTSFISKLLEKDDTIRNAYYTYSFSMTPFFLGVNWEAEVKVFRSPHEFIKESPIFPVGRIQIEMFSPDEPRPKMVTTQFEITSKDVKDMIKHLEDLDKALENLKTAKITPGK